MKKTENIPYVKVYNENGELTNPINGFYKSGVSKRTNKKERFMNNSKGIQLVVTKTSKYYKRLQKITFVDDKGTIKNKVIEHYIKA